MATWPRSPPPTILDPASRCFPVGIAQLALDDLAGILARQFGLETDHARHLEIGEPLAQERADDGLVECSAGFGLDIGAKRLAEFFVRDAEDGAVAHAGEGE